jgi:hypothetical protein
MAVTYDENIILTFTERLYRRAASMVIAYALFGAMVGALAGVGIAIATSTPELIKGVAAAIGAVGAVIGGMVGSERAFALRLLAQQALCQVQFERNTRGAAPAAASAVPVVSRPPPPPTSMPRGGAR